MLISVPTIVAVAFNGLVKISVFTTSYLVFGGLNCGEIIKEEPAQTPSKVSSVS